MAMTPGAWPASRVSQTSVRYGKTLTTASMPSPVTYRTPPSAVKQNSLGAMESGRGPPGLPRGRRVGGGGAGGTQAGGGERGVGGARGLGGGVCVWGGGGGRGGARGGGGPPSRFPSP